MFYFAYYSCVPTRLCHSPYKKKLNTFGIHVTNRVNLPNSLLPHALSRYLPPNQITAKLMLRLMMLFSTNAAVIVVHGYCKLFSGTRTR